MRLVTGWAGRIRLLAFTVAVFAASSDAADIPVSDTCSLADAIRSSNQDAAVGGCAAGTGSGDRIVLAPGSKIRVDAPAPDGGPNGPTAFPQITDTMVLAGNGSVIRRRGAQPMRFFNFLVRNGGFRIEDLTLSDGIATDTVAPQGFFGGAIFIKEGSVTLVRSTISGGTAGRGGAIADDFGIITLRSSTIADNAAIALPGQPASGVGGGIALFGFGSSENSTISGNTAATDGGGFYHESEVFTLDHFTITGNTAGARGGGVFVASNDLNSIRWSLVAGNAAPSGPEIFVDAGFLGGQNNLIGSAPNGTVGYTKGGTDVETSAALSTILKPLAVTLGNTPTHDLVPGSPAIDGIPDAQGLYTVDQRGVSRPQEGDGVAPADDDNGAVEFVVLPSGVPPPPPRCMKQNATIVGTDGPDVLEGTNGKDVIKSRGGDDIVRGNGGDDVICAGGGNDLILGNQGDDASKGGGGNDEVRGGKGADLLKGGTGDDFLTGGGGLDDCNGGSGSDVIDADCDAQTP